MELRALGSTKLVSHGLHFLRAASSTTQPNTQTAQPTPKKAKNHEEQNHSSAPPSPVEPPIPLGMSFSLECAGLFSVFRLGDIGKWHLDQLFLEGVNSLVFMISSVSLLVSVSPTAGTRSASLTIKSVTTRLQRVESRQLDWKEAPGSGTESSEKSGQSQVRFAVDNRQHVIRCNRVKKPKTVSVPCGAPRSLQSGCWWWTRPQRSAHSPQVGWCLLWT